MGSLGIVELSPRCVSAMTAFVPPQWCGLEVTDHPMLTGASLARMAAMPHSEAAAALAAVLSSISA